MTRTRFLELSRLWVPALLLAIAAMLLFDHRSARAHAAVYPRWNDQIQYLGEAYGAYEHARNEGYPAALVQAFRKRALQGSLHDVAALGAFRLSGGPSRRALLNLNMAAFVAWFIALLYTMRQLGASRPLAWMAGGLLFCVAWPWEPDAGSAVDFRLDHAAMCLFGLTSLLALLSRGFRSAGWSLVFGGTVGLTLLQRFLTGAYFTPIFLGCAVWCLVGDSRGRRFRNLALAGAVAAGLALPLFWMNREVIYGYYWVGHVTGAESSARSAALGLWPSLQFVAGNLFSMHLGPWFGWVALFLSLGLFAGGWCRRLNADWRGDHLVIALLYLLVPVLVLSLHRQKSPYVLGIIVPGVILTVAWLWRLGLERAACTPTDWRRHLPVALAVAATLAGAGHFAVKQLRPAHTPEFLASAHEVAALADHIYTAARLGGVGNPAVGVDQVVDFADAQFLGILCYERHHKQVSFVTRFPESIIAMDDDEVFRRLAQCDFVLLTDRQPHDGHWPYDKHMHTLYPELKAWCDANLRLSKFVHAFGRDMSLYQRREIP